MCGSFHICNVCQIKCIKSIGIWFWHQFEYTKVSLNMQVRLYTSVDYAEISLYILCVYVGVSGNDDRGMKCVWPLLFSACISVLFSLKQWLQAAAVGWGRRRGKCERMIRFMAVGLMVTGLCASVSRWPELSQQVSPPLTLPPRALSLYPTISPFSSFCLTASSALLFCWGVRAARPGSWI